MEKTSEEKILRAMVEQLWLLANEWRRRDVKDLVHSIRTDCASELESVLTNEFKHVV